MRVFVLLCTLGSLFAASTTVAATTAADAEPGTATCLLAPRTLEERPLAEQVTYGLEGFADCTGLDCVVHPYSDELRSPPEYAFDLVQAVAGCAPAGIEL